MPTFQEMQQQDARDNIARLDTVLSTLPGTGQTGDIAGYTYRADNHKPQALVEILIAEQRLSPGARGMDADEALDQLAGVEGIDRADEYSFDSDDFPKVILMGQLSMEDIEWLVRA